MTGWARPNPQLQYVCNFTNGVPRQRFSSSEKKLRTVSPKRKKRKKQRKIERKKTTHRTRMPGRTFSLRYSPPSFAEGKAKYPSNPKRILPFVFSSYFACLLPCWGRKPDRWQSRRRYNADQGLRPRAAIRLQLSSKESLAKLSLPLKNATSTHHTELVRKMPSPTFLSGNWKNSGWAVILIEWSIAIVHLTATANSKIKSLTVVWQSSSAVHGHMKVL